jgi:aspartyl-tRNA(Asn)/glutamyl-tRNA(Gln) amidotransferase subunit C
MQIDDALIDKLARLSQLDIPPGEREGLRSDLQKMIAFVDKLNELDTTGMEPLLHMSPVADVLRDDVPGPMLRPEQALKNSRGNDGRFFTVPRVINKNEPN